MDKQRLKSAIYSYQIRVTAIVAEGVANRASKREILNKCRREILHFKLSDAEREQLMEWVNYLYRKTVVAAHRELDEDKRKDNIISVLKKEAPVLEHQKNVIADEVEYRLKLRELTQAVKEGKFFYCTVHSNPAEGHAAYQGKIYYRGNRSYSKEETEYIKKHNLMTVEEAITSVQLVVRRNCRHRLVPVTFSSVKEGVTLNEKSFHVISYEESQYRVYYDRLRLLLKLKKKGFDVEKELAETRKLVQKWKTAYRAKSSG